MAKSGSKESFLHTLPSLEGMTVAEAAAKLKVKPNTIKNYLAFNARSAAHLEGGRIHVNHQLLDEEMRSENVNAPSHRVNAHIRNSENAQRQANMDSDYLKRTPFFSSLRLNRGSAHGLHQMMGADSACRAQAYNREQELIRRRAGGRPTRGRKIS